MGTKYSVPQGVEIVRTRNEKRNKVETEHKTKSLKQKPMKKQFVKILDKNFVDKKIPIKWLMQ